MGRAAGVTLAYAIVGSGLSIALGLVGGVVSSRIWWQILFPPGRVGHRLGRGLWLCTRGLLAFPRAIHELIWGLMLLQLFGLDPLVAVGAIAIPFGAIVAKVFSEILDETPREPLYALLSSGVAPLQALLYGLLPQALPNLLSYSFYRFECSLRAAATLGIIGAGGIGYEIYLSLQSLRYDQLWTGFYALILLNGAADAWSALVRRRMGFTSRLDLNLKPGSQFAAEDGTASAPDSPASSASSMARPPGPKQDWVLRLSWMGVALALPLAFSFLGINWSLLWAPRTRILLGEMATSLSLALPAPTELGNLLYLAYLTLAMSILAGTLAGIGGMIMSFPAAQNFALAGGVLDALGQSSAYVSLGRATVLAVSRVILLVSRAIPAPIWALVFLFVLFPGILPGALALGMHNFGILGRLMAEVNENIDDRPVRALRALGASSGHLMIYGVMPQNLSRFLAYGLYRWEVCLRETVVVGLVGAGGLGRLLTEQISSFDYGGVGLTLVVFFLLTLGVDAISHRMRHSLK